MLVIVVSTRSLVNRLGSVTLLCVQLLAFTPLTIYRVIANCLVVTLTTILVRSKSVAVRVVTEIRLVHQLLVEA